LPTVLAAQIGKIVVYKTKNWQIWKNTDRGKASKHTQ